MTKYTDTQLLNFLQGLNDEAQYTGTCSLRISSNGRGWRLHETTLEGSVVDVREAISNFMNDIKETK